MKLGVIALAGGGVVLALASWLITEQQEGYLAPVIGPDKQVYFLRRVSTGAVLGLGWEFFTPPAKVLVWSDQFQLCRTSLDRKGFEVIATLPRSPLEHRWISEYRNRLFVIPNAAMRFEGDQLEWEIGLRIPRQPTSEPVSVKGKWNWRQSAITSQTGWGPGEPRMSMGEDMLRDSWEVLALVAGGSATPCAIVAHEDPKPEVRVLTETSGCKAAYGSTIAWESIRATSKADEIRRLRILRARRESLIAGNRATGMLEGSAILSADRTLAEEGFYPKSAQWRAQVARQVPQEMPVFDISDQEFRMGLFPDIEQAIESPGHEVEKPSHAYVTHRDFDTSRKLNTYLAKDPKELFVRRGGTVFRLEVIPARPILR